MSGRLILCGLLVLIGTAGLLEYWARLYAPELAHYPRKGFVLLRRAVLTAGILSFYLFTALGIPVWLRSAGEGRAGFPVPGVTALLAVYEFPLLALERACPPAAALGAAVAEAWDEILDAPDTT